jgi:TM2 domain-containing membrane protein YozV
MSDTIQQARLQNTMKNPIVALALGFFIPGAAQMYAGSVLWGAINLILVIVLAITVIASPLAFIIWLVSMFIGYKNAKAFNEKILDNAESVK